MTDQVFYPSTLQTMTLEDLATRVAADAKARRDFITDSRKITLLPYETSDGGGNGPGAEMHIDGVGEFPVLNHAHNQLAGILNFPRKFYDRTMAAYPAEWGQMTNAILRREPTKRMVRTLHGNARAVLSDRYRALDNYELVQAVLPILGQIPDVQFPRMNVTDTRLYITAVSPNVTGEVVPGDVVQAGVRIQNSEVGNGALAVYPVIWRGVCSNGMVRESFGERKYHIGGRAEDSDHAFEVFSDETRQLADAAFFAKIGDVVRAAVSDTLFSQIVDQLRNAADQHIQGDPVAAVQEVANTFDMTDTEQGGVMRHLIEGGDLSMWGVINAITRTAQDTSDFDRAMDLERAGGRMMELPAKDWTRIATAA